jgi:hypothetical protein
VQLLLWKANAQPAQDIQVQIDAVNSDITGTEGDNTEFMVCVEAVSPSGGTITLPDTVTTTLAVEMGSKGNVQFQGSNEVNLPADDPRGCATFSIEDDNIVGGVHSVTFVIESLSSTDDIMINTMMNTHEFTIMDNDGPVSISFNDASPTVMEGAGPLTVCAVLNLPDATMLGCDIEVTFVNLPGNLADNVSDYTFPPSPTDTFLVTDNDGETICIDIQITDDDDYEADHQFAVRIDLSVPPSVAVAGGNALVTIMDNNDAGVRMVSTMVSAREMTGMTSTVDVCVDPDVEDIELQLTVQLTATNGEAVEGEDFQSPSPLEVIFNVASPAVPLCVTFDILDDSDLEGDHSFTVQITGVGPAAVIASPDTTTVIIDDDDDEQIIVSMSDATMSVDEGMNPNMHHLCVTIEILGGGVAECEMTATVVPVAGTASMCVVFVS